MKIARVFPRKTNASPTDDLSFFGLPSMFLPHIDEVHVSVTFDWDKKRAEWLAKNWEQIAPTRIGGPAYDDPGGPFEPGRYLNQDYVITSRGCPNRCWFCEAWKNEGNEVRELPINEGWNLLDNNILACSGDHQEKVFQMLLRQKKRPRFTGGLEAARLKEWHIEWLIRLKPRSAFFAYDEPNDLEPLVNASRLLNKAGILKNNIYGCYVLIGYKGDTILNAEQRLNKTVELGFFPQAMLFNRKKDYDWRHFQREWANKKIVGYKMKLRRLQACH